MSRAFKRLSINGEHFISFLNSSFLIGQSIGKYLVNLLKSPDTTHTHTKEEEKKDKSLNHSVNTLHHVHFSFFARNQLLLSCFRTED